VVEETQPQKNPATLPSPEARRQQKRLHKEGKEKPAGFRKLFSRKNRAPKDSETDVMATRNQATPEPPAEQMPTPSPSPSPAPGAEPYRPSEESAAVSPVIEEAVETPTTPRGQYPVNETSNGQELSRVNTREEDEAKKEFARFDQGPLSDQPAFVPDHNSEDEDEDDATPPPIARHPVRTTSANRLAKHAPEGPEEKLSESAGPGVQDRWAQIRKAAAERAAQRQSEEHSRGGQSKTTDGDEDTSGEESIEARVARIRARVAELTGNAQGANGPGSPGSPSNGKPSRAA
jgi:hypothetical protein